MAMVEYGGSKWLSRHPSVGLLGDVVISKNFLRGWMDAAGRVEGD